MGRRRWLAGAQWLLGLLVVVFVARSVAANWDQVRQAELAWRLTPPYLAAAVALVWLAFTVLAESWRRMVTGWGYRLGRFEAARVWLLSSMAKYVPGKVWTLAGLAVLARDRGVPAWAAAGSAVLLQLVALSTGALVVAASGVAVLGQQSLPEYVLLLALATGTAGVLVTILWPPVARRLVAGATRQAPPHPTPGPREASLAVAATFAGWVAYGAAFWLFARGTLPGTPLTLTESIGAYTASYLAGVIAPFAPAGLGVREGVLVLALRDRTGLANALALAAVARLGMTAAEVAATVPFLIRRPGQRRD